MRKKRGLMFLGPAKLFFLFWFFGVIVPIIPFLDGNDGFSLMWPYYFNDKFNSVVVAIFIYLSVLILFLLGYALSVRIFRPKKHFPAHQKLSGLSFELRAVTIALIGVLSLVLLIYLVGGVSNWLQAGSNRIMEFAGLNFIVLLQNGLLSVSIAWFIKITDNPIRFDVSNHRLFFFYSLFSLLIVAFQGAKSTLFVYLFSMLVIWHVKVKFLPFWRLALIGVFFYISLMFYHLVKQEYLVVGYFVFYNPSDGWVISFVRFLLQQLTGNLMQLQTMTVLVDAMPTELEFQYGETLKMVFLIWIPSLLYPDKPLTAPGVFTTALWPEKWLAEGTTMPPGIFGELFMNFGFFGAIIGAFIFGTIYGIYYMRVLHFRRQIDLGLYAVMAGLMLHYFRGELASVTVLFFSLFIPLTWVLKGRSKTERSNSNKTLTSNFLK